MPKVFTSDTQKTGEVGENIAAKFLVKHGYSIMDRNYTKKWGEIDIVTKKGAMIHFIEVKSVSATGLPNQDTNTVPHETDNYRPEDNMHPWKLKRLSRAIQTYLLEKDIELEWQLDLVTVKIDQQNRRARVEIIENVII